MLRSVANELRSGDLVCEVPDKKLRAFFVVVRPVQQGGLESREEVIFGEIVGIASFPLSHEDDNGERMSGDVREVCLLYHSMRP
jgi:hypothetical protein